VDIAILSDLHLGSENCRDEDLNAFLDSRRWDRLYLNGDIVDHLNFKKFKRRHWRLMERLASLNPVVLLGNHDRPKEGSECLIRRFFKDAVRELVVVIAGKKYLMAHGDAFDPLLNWQLLTELADQFYMLTQKVSKTVSRWLKKRSKSFGGFIDKLLGRAAKLAKTRDCHGFILGHTHAAEDRLHDGLHYLNSGCWTGSEQPTYLAALDGGGPVLKTFVRGENG